ncbi:uncharacterized protein LOC120355517 [Nilaparvata lugens]|uniref:uncharacterized protein LOC120355517 n=1 Tax=Nilaparvata lugens TaxID=108931 RepID=UPI00193EACA2|nr:uncharacterized protein LOC120355517 [Nilaparvata lugens]
MVTSILKEYASFAGAEGSRNRTVHRFFRNTVMPTTNLTANDIASCVESAVNGLSQMEHNTVALQVVTDLYCCLSSITKLAIETPAGNRAPHVDIWVSWMDRVSWESLSLFNRSLSDILHKVSLNKVPGKHLDLTVGLAIFINSIFETLVVFSLPIIPVELIQFQ